MDDKHFLPKLLLVVVFIRAAETQSGTEPLMGKTHVGGQAMTGSCGDSKAELSSSNRQAGLLPGDGAKSRCRCEAGSWLRQAEAKG